MGQGWQQADKYKEARVMVGVATGRRITRPDGRAGSRQESGVPAPIVTLKSAGGEGSQMPGGDSGKLIDVVLASGRPLWCWRYVTAYTYDGFMIRTPSENCNEHMLEIVRREASQDFGEWPVHIIQPMRRPGEIDYPRVRVTGFFTSFPIRGEMHLSSLVVAWFQDQPWPVPDAVSRPALEGIDWERLAVDYET